MCFVKVHLSLTPAVDTTVFMDQNILAKSYNEAKSLCASFIRDVRMSPSLNTALLGEINHIMCTV